MTTTTINHTDWSLYDIGGYLQSHGVEVQDVGEGVIRINGTQHRADDLVISEDRIDSKVGGWYLLR